MHHNRSYVYHHDVMLVAMCTYKELVLLHIEHDLQKIFQVVKIIIAH